MEDANINSRYVCPRAPHPALPPLNRGNHRAESPGAPSEDRKRLCFLYEFICLWFFPPFQSLEPLPPNGPDFGALGEEAEFVEVEPEAKQEILENKDVVVQHVHFDGLGRTKDDVIMYEIGDVFKAKNLIEVSILSARRSFPSLLKIL